MSLPVIYLAGAIRDGKEEDWKWREWFATSLKPMATVLNPLAGKTYAPNSRLWIVHGEVPDAKLIVAQDFWCVDRADILVINYTALAEGYPSIGTLIEHGRATVGKKIIYSIVSEGFHGHESVRLYKLHPFIAETSAKVFKSTTSCLNFLAQMLPNLNGHNPHFGGVI